MNDLPLTSPLAEIEGQVQERAKNEAAERDQQATDTQLRALVTEEIERWNDDYRRGRRDYPIANVELVTERAMRNLSGYGPLEPLLNDDNVWEIMVNAPDAIFVKRHHGPSGYHDEAFHDDDHVTRTLTKILDDSTGAHRTLDPSAGLQDAQLGTAARLHIVHHDIARGGHLIVNIRKFTGLVVTRLDELVERSMLSTAASTFLKSCIAARQTVIFAGVPGTGKTTLLGCCAAELDPTLRVVIAEEVFEADIPLPNVASMQTRSARVDRPEVNLERLVSGFLRMAPDVAIVGEVRDREALPLLLTLSSGVTGFTTIHAGSARKALTRLRFVCQLSEAARGLGLAGLTTLVSETVDVVVHCRRTERGPRVQEILAVEDCDDVHAPSAFQTTTVFRHDPTSDGLEVTGDLPVRLGRRFRNSGIDLNSILAQPQSPIRPSPEVRP